MNENATPKKKKLSFDNILFYAAAAVFVAAVGLSVTANALVGSRGEAAYNESSGVSEKEDNAGDKTESKTICYWYEYAYNADGNRIQGIHCYPDDSINVRYEYDVDGNLTQSTSYTPDGSVFFRSEYEYNTRGRRIRYVHYNSMNGATFECEYDAAGNEINRVLYDVNGDIVPASEYDADGKEINMTLTASKQRKSGTAGTAPRLCMNMIPAG